MYSADFESALRAVGLPVAHWAFVRNGKPAPPSTDHIVYAEDPAYDFIAGGRHVERATVGTVDLYTRDYSGKTIAKVETVFFERPRLVWRQNYLDYEADTGFLHCEWVISEYENFI